jgi:hypothetical protein
VKQDVEFVFVDHVSKVLAAAIPLLADRVAKVA